MSWLLKRLAALKSSPRTWAVAGPLLLALGVHFHHFWWIPLVVYGVILGSGLNEAQLIHAMIGLLATTLLGWWGWLAWPVFVALELYFDPKYENAPFWPGGATDLTSYTVGLFLGLFQR